MYKIEKRMSLMKEDPIQEDQILNFKMKRMLIVIRLDFKQGVQTIKLAEVIRRKSQNVSIPTESTTQKACATTVTTSMEERILQPLASILIEKAMPRVTADSATRNI